MAHADWIIDLGPGAGHDGGRIVFEGTPADLVAARSTLTGEHLAAYVGLSWRCIVRAGGAVATGPWDVTAAVTPGLLAGDADRERAIDLLKTAFVQGVLTRDELAARTGHALQARTYGQLAAVTAALEPRTPEPRKPEPRKPEPRTPAARRPASTIPAPARLRVSKKVVAWGACAIVLPPALAATFLSTYGGFLVMFLLTFIATVLCSKPPARGVRAGRVRAR